MTCFARIFLALLIVQVMPAGAEAKEAKDAASDSVTIIPAIQKVITMLNNLVQTLDAETKDDEEKFGHFTKWAAKEIEHTTLEISRLQTEIEDLKASLAALYARRSELSARVAKLKADIAMTQNQINQATEKRNAEHQAFVEEQTNFDNAVAACGKAVDILSQHYGDGSEPAAAVKPDFVSLLEPYFATIRKSAGALGFMGRHKGVSLLKTAHPDLRRAMSFLQGPYDRYEGKTDQGLNIVDQVKVLASTFAEDKQSSIDEENRLQGVYNNLMAEKTAMLADLQADFAQTSKQLAEVNQSISEQESALSRAEKQLADAQTYLQLLKDGLKTFTENYEHRQKDRADERAAVMQALGVLDKYNTFLEKNSNTAKDTPACKSCGKAVALLHQDARLFHSAMLEAAATASASLEALDDIIRNLEGLIKRIDQEAEAELHHKEWCEKETGLTTKKREDHSGILTELQQVLANLGEVVVEKKTDLGMNKEDKDEESMSFEEREQLRNEEHDEFELDLKDHMEAIQALNQAIDILAKYYASRKEALLQQGGKISDLQQNPGGKVVNMLAKTRSEFETAKIHLEEDEDQEIKEFGEEKALHTKTETNLEQTKDTLTVEKQTAEDSITQAEDDVQSNEQEVKSAENYLDQLGRSCYPLLMRYDDRVKLRNEEKKAIEDAITVLRNEA